MLKSLLAREGIDKKLAVFLLAAGIIALILSTTVYPSLLFIQAAVTLLLASAIYLFLRWRRRKAVVDEEAITEQEDVPRLHPSYSKLLDIVFWGLFIASLLLISQEAYARPLSFLIIVAIMTSILAVEIFTGKSTLYCILKILIIGILLRASAWYQFPSPVGYDSIVETNFLEQLLATGHSGSFMEDYGYYPIAFYFAASTSIITGWGTTSSFFILGVIETMSLVFLFLIGRQIFNAKIGLLIALIVAVFDWHVLWGFYVKAMTLGIAWLPVILFLIIAAQQRHRLSFAILSILFMFITILTHTFAIAALFAVLLIGWFVFLIIRNMQRGEKLEQPIKLNMVLLLFCATLAYWMYVSGFTKYIAYAANYAFSIDAGEIGVLILPMDTLETIWTRLPIFLLIFLAILGSLHLLNIREWNSNTTLRVWLALLGGILLIVNFVIFSLPELSPMVRERWFVFTGLILAIPAAIGLLSIPGQRGWQSLTVLFLLVFPLSGIMTTSYIANVDSVIPWGPQSYNAATTSELTAAETMGQITSLAPSNAATGTAVIYADHYYSQIFIYHVRLSNDKVIDFSELKKEELEDYDGILMLRTSVVDVVSIHEELVMDQSQYHLLMNDPEVNLIYDSGTVKALRRL